LSCKLKIHKMQTITLFRPVGLYEMSLLWDQAFQAFPPRLSHQPYFYPVTNAEYARQIASKWNVNDEGSGFCGYVTRFDVSADYLGRFEPRIVGSSVHCEYWIPSEILSEFNSATIGKIAVDEAYFGPEFRGFIPEKYGLQGKNAIEQFVVLAKTWDYSRIDFALEIWTNQKAVYLNSWFWAQHDFERDGIGREAKRSIAMRLRESWEHYKISIPLPTSLQIA